MIEVDVFWSFAFGAGFASAASSVLRDEESPFANNVFAYTAVFLGAIFGPSGIYLLWRFPGWESMFLFTEGKVCLQFGVCFFLRNLILFFFF